MASMRGKSSASLILLVLLAACTAGPPAVAPSASPAHTVLEGTQWKLISLKGQKPLDGTTITLSFASGILRTISGSDGCNDYNGPYQATLDGGLTITQTEVTVVQCFLAGISAQEDAYMSALQKAAAYRVANGELEIFDAAGDRLLVFQRENVGDIPFGAHF